MLKSDRAADLFRRRPTSEAEEGEEVLRLGLAPRQVLDGGGQGRGGERGERRGGGGGQPAVQAARVGHFDGRGAGRVGLRLGELPLGLQPRSE